MIELRHNNCQLLHIHKQGTYNCDLIEVARPLFFVAVSDECKKHFGAFK